MDTFPGMQFEPFSLHKYLYCHGSPIDNWDPSGRDKTLLGTIARIGIGMILVSRVYTNAFHLLSWLLGKKDPVEWTGNMVYATYGPRVIGWSWGVILAGLTGQKEGEPSVSESFIILMAGAAISPLSRIHVIFKVNWGIPLGGIKIETPGIIGVHTIALCGPVSWLSLSAVPGVGKISDKPGLFKSASSFYMGMGKADFPRPEWLIGIDVGAEAMGGWSFPLSP